MKDFVACILIIVILAGLGIFAIDSLTPYPKAPLGFQEWSPIPVVCAGYSCVTYREWSAAMREDKANNSAATVLSALVLNRVVKTVANYEKIRVTSEDADQAINAIEKTLGSVPGGSQILNETYASGLAATGKKDIITLLMKEKLQAVGIKSPWDSEYVPKITVWNRWLKWDNSNKVVVSVDN